MSKGEECRALIEKATERSGRSRSSSTTPASSTSRAIEEFPIEKWNAIIAINLSSAFHTSAAALPAMRAAGLGPHRQHRLGARADRLALQVRLCVGQARARRLHQDRGAGAGRGAHHLQRDLPRLRADAAGRGADPRPDEGPQSCRETRDQGGDAGIASRRTNSRTSRRSAGLPCSSAPTRRRRSPARLSASTAAGRRSRPRILEAASLSATRCPCCCHRRATRR